MFDLKPELRENEAVLGEYGATVYRVRGGVSSAGSNIRLWLTDQRLILKAALGPQRTLPLYAIANIREEKIVWYTMVRLEFASGHLEWLTVQNQEEFLNRLRAAQAQAPQIPEETPPVSPSLAATTPIKGGLIFIAVMSVCFLVCMDLFLFAVGILLFIARTR